MDRAGVPDDGSIDHLEAFLGQITSGWIEDATGDRQPFQVVCFDDAPEKELATYSTLGLSRHVLESPAKLFRQELLVSVDKRFASPQLASVLSTIGCRVLAGNAIVRPRDTDLGDQTCIRCNAASGPCIWCTPPTHGTPEQPATNAQLLARRIPLTCQRPRADTSGTIVTTVDAIEPEGRCSTVALQRQWFGARPEGTG